VLLRVHCSFQKTDSPAIVSMCDHERSLVCQAAAELVFHDILTFFKENNDSVYVLGLGTGTTVVPFLVQLKALVSQHPLAKEWGRIVLIPTSLQSRMLVIESYDGGKFGELGSLDQHQELHITVDGADVVDLHSHVLVKGGGAAHALEKIVMSISRRYVIVAIDSSKKCRPWIGVPIPVEVLPVAWTVVRQHLLRLRLVERSEDVLLRQSTKGKAGPVITDNGNMILDVKVSALMALSAAEINRAINEIPGVVETGIFSCPKGRTTVFVTDQLGQLEPHSL
jgi:ribose 5-phosphate isomerase A